MKILHDEKIFFVRIFFKVQEKVLSFPTHPTRASGSVWARNGARNNSVTPPQPGSQITVFIWVQPRGWEGKSWIWWQNFQKTPVFFKMRLLRAQKELEAQLWTAWAFFVILFGFLKIWRGFCQILDLGRFSDLENSGKFRYFSIFQNWFSLALGGVRSPYFGTLPPVNDTFGIFENPTWIFTDFGLSSLKR